MPLSPVVTCDHHPAAAAIARCLVCGVPLCEACAAVVEGHSVCAAHAADYRLLHQAKPPPELPRPDLTTRALAYVTDGAILFGIGAFMLSIIMALLRPQISFDATILVHVALFSAALAIYTTYFISQYGRTPGQSLFHIRVVDEEGGTISVGHAFLRWVGYFVSTLTLFYGFLIAARDPLGRGWPDKLAGTLVVGPSLAPARKLRAGVTLAVVVVFEVLYTLFTLSVR